MPTTAQIKAKEAFDKAKKKTDNKIKKNRKSIFGDKSGIPETTQSKKRLGTTLKNLVSPAKSSEPKTFGAAFKAARNKLGAGKTFTYKGKKYTTNRADDKKKSDNYSAGPVKKRMAQVDNFSKSKVKQGPPKPPAKKPKKSLGSKFMSFIKGEGSKMKKDFNNAVSETKRNFGMAKKKKPVKKNNMDFGGKKKKVEAPMYESMGTMGGVKKMKMAKGYSKGGTVFTGR
jgi:hypothetical protein